MGSMPYQPRHILEIHKFPCRLLKGMFLHGVLSELESPSKNSLGLVCTFLAVSIGRKQLYLWR